MTKRHRHTLLLILGVEVALRVAIIVHAGPMTDQGFYGDRTLFASPDATGIAHRLYHDAVDLPDHLDPDDRIGLSMTSTLTKKFPTRRPIFPNGSMTPGAV